MNPVMYSFIYPGQLESTYLKNKVKRNVWSSIYLDKEVLLVSRINTPV